ncbi:RDD family protein [Vibrio splendidus]|uniref:RDD family protein n=1 Tax=Vibrio splendidus TaxID=29497 RepID=UPI000C8656F8|nr:RDD family protein [Vibrio splendidus]MCC5517267.1 RDD family protein [Vibrio splendidus]
MSEVIENTPATVLASRWSRLWASIIDAFVYAIFIVPVFLYGGLYDKLLSNETIELTEQVVLTVYGWVGYFLCQGYLLHKNGQTIGKNLMDIAIVDMEGKQIGLLNIVGKRIVPMVAVAYIPFIGPFISTLDYLFVFRKDKRCLHDLIAGTQVVIVSKKSSGSDNSEIGENTKEVIPASRWPRFLAFFIDGVITVAIIAPIFMYTDCFQKTIDTGVIDLREVAAVYAYLGLMFLLVHGYLLNKKGQTIGKHLMEIAIVDMEGKPIGLYKIVGKRMIPMIPFTIIPITGHLISMLDSLFIFRKNRRCLHDLIAGTQVVSVSANNLGKNEHESLESLSSTVENIPEVRLASRWLRFWAIFIDVLIAVAIVMPIYLYTDYFQKLSETGTVDTTELIAVTAYGWFVFLLLNGYLLHKKGQTIGKNIMEIAIVDMKGEQMGLFNILGKRVLPMTIVLYIPLIGQFIALLNYLFALRKNRRCLHDLIAGSQVVSVAVPRNLDFSTIE